MGLRSRISLRRQDSSVTIYGGAGPEDENGRCDWRRLIVSGALLGISRLIDLEQIIDSE